MDMFIHSINQFLQVFLFIIHLGFSLWHFNLSTGKTFNPGSTFPEYCVENTVLFHPFSANSRRFCALKLPLLKNAALNIIITKTAKSKKPFSKTVILSISLLIKIASGELSKGPKSHC